MKECDSEDLDLIARRWELKSRESFYTYRKYINYPKFIDGYFPQSITADLQKFYDDMVAGLRPMLIIMAPPQHGKSIALTDFTSWFMGKQPDNKVVYASFSDRLGVRANRTIQKTFDSEKYKSIFPELTVGGRRVVTVSGQLLRNNEIVETSEGGFFRNTTVNGAITGEGLDLGIVDDPIKGRNSANSKTVREATWDWLTDDFMTRFSEFAGTVMILTRWHVDDPAGRMIDQLGDIEKDTNGRVRIRKYEAINKNDEALFEEHKSLEFLKLRKSTMQPGNWQSIYQQNPVLTGGNIIKSEWWRWGTVRPKIKYRFITADTAQKKNNWNDYSVFQCWGMDYAGEIHLIDQYRKRLTSPELRKKAEEFYDRHNGIKHEPLRGMWIEDKSSGSGLIQELELKKLKVHAVQRGAGQGKAARLDDILRANDIGPEIASGKIWLYKDVDDVDVIVDEASAFPNGINDDAFDCTMTAIEITYLGENTYDYAGLV